MSAPLKSRPLKVVVLSMLWNYQIKWSIVTPRISSCFTVAVKPPPEMVLNDDSAESNDFISPKNPIF